MGDLCLIAASLMARGQAPGWKLTTPANVVASPANRDSSVATLCKTSPNDWVRLAIAEVEMLQPEFSQSWRSVSTRPVSPIPARPASGGQLYHQRWAALKAGKIYTRIAADSFREAWLNATDQPTYRQWVDLLAQEARAMAWGQGNNRLTVILGDSLFLWFPSERLSSDRFWLNQGISGDTTTGALHRLHLLDQTRPDVIHVMVGINDLRHGASNEVVLTNLREIMQRLRQAHPQAQIYVHSILPTRLAALPSDRIRWLNYNIAAIAKQEGVSFLNLQPAFSNRRHILRADLTTDGLHLNQRGYATWQAALSPIF
jgi:lysophospholipase L1-like esterase